MYTNHFLFLYFLLHTLTFYRIKPYQRLFLLLKFATIQRCCYNRIMKNRVLLAAAGLLFASCTALADRFVPEFSKMKTIKCNIEETIYSQDNSVITQNTYFRIFNIDDENKKLYLQKSPVYKTTYYDIDKLEFTLQHLTDDFIMLSSVSIDRSNGNYKSESSITYDNSIFGVRKAVGVGTCSPIN